MENPKHAFKMVDKKIIAFKSLSRQYFFSLKMLSAFYICCINSSAFQTKCFIEAKTMNPDQSAPIGAV